MLTDLGPAFVAQLTFVGQARIHITYLSVLSQIAPRGYLEARWIVDWGDPLCPLWD
jgi:hypothetical protein